MANPWRKLWLRRQARVKRTMRRSFLPSLFGRRLLDRGLWRADRDTIAGGLALGLFIAFTPTMPFQMLLATAGAVFFRVNLPMALAACWVTNPLTAVPIYLAAWELGRSIIEGLPLVRDFLDLFLPESTRFRHIIRNSIHLWTGALLLALPAAIAGRIVVRLLWRLATSLAHTTQLQRHHRQTGNMLLALLPMILLTTALLIQKSGIIDLGLLRTTMENSTVPAWMPFLLTAAMAGLYALALGGATLLILVLGLLYPPPLATAMATVGGVLGSIAAYHLAHGLKSSTAARRADSWIFRALSDNSGFLTLCVLRTMPGFPPAIISYSAGIIRAPWTPFIISAIAGFAIKSFVYTAAIHTVIMASPATDISSFLVLWPLLACLLLGVMGLAVEMLMRGQQTPAPPIKDT